MVKIKKNKSDKESLKIKASKIKFVFSDVDGVLTDGNVYYSAEGEILKKFSLRDGMAVELLREKCGIEVGLVTGENSVIVRRRAEKLRIEKIYLGVRNKLNVLSEFLPENGYSKEEIAYIGDDVNDMEIMQMVGLSACPSDAVKEIKKIADFRCKRKGGDSPFRELADFIISSNLKTKKKGKRDE